MDRSYSCPDCGRSVEQYGAGRYVRWKRHMDPNKWGPGDQGWCRTSGRRVSATERAPID